MDVQKTIARIHARLAACELKLFAPYVNQHMHSIRLELAFALESAASLATSLHAYDAAHGRPLIAALRDAIAARSNAQAIDAVAVARHALAHWADCLDAELP